VVRRFPGGLRGGRVIGQSTSENLTPKHLISTILHTVFDVGQLRLIPALASVARLAEHAPLPV